jgi:hypothetical protein
MGREIFQILSGKLRRDELDACKNAAFIAGIIV